MAIYKVHTFTTSANLVINSLTGNPAYDTVEYLVVAGGGGGGTLAGGGGGAGGLLSNTLNLSVGTQVITVGGGGVGGTGNNGPGSDRWGKNGSNSIIGSLVVSSGGGGGGGNSAAPPRGGGTNGGAPGGSGGGSSQPGSGVSIGLGTAGQGNPGALYSSPAGGNQAIGGGGAGAAGIPLSWDAPTYGQSGFTGGIGLNSNISGSVLMYSAGGHGSRATGNVQNGAARGYGGDGAADFPVSGGSGGSGIVIVRYPVLDVASTVQSRVSRVSSVIPDVTRTVPNASIIISVTTLNAANGEILYYSTSGNITQFIGANTGSFLVFGNANSTISVTPFNQEGNLRVQIRRNSITGSILDETSNIVIDRIVLATLSISPSANGISSLQISTSNLYLPAGTEYTITNTSRHTLILRGHVYGAGTGNTGGYTRGEFTLAANANIRAMGGMSVPTSVPTNVMSGGGASAIYNSSNSAIALLVAGGSGGGDNQGGGQGGGIAGSEGRNFTSPDGTAHFFGYGPVPAAPTSARGGSGGNQTAGGDGGYGGRGPGTPGRFREGGSWGSYGGGGTGWAAGGAGAFKPGDGWQGGGGGGWFGGGGGGASLTGAEGGGGSGYISPTISNGFTTNVWSNVNIHPAAPQSNVGNYLSPGSIVIEFRGVQT